MVDAINKSEFSQDDFYFDNDKYQPSISRDPRRPLITPQEFSSAKEAVKTATLQSRVELLSSSTDSKSSFYSIDKALYAVVPSDQLRKLMTDHWESLRLSYTSSAWLNGIVTVICGIGAIAAAHKEVNPLLIGAISICGIATFTLTIYNFYWAGTASSQKAGWQVSPAHRIAENRKIALARGFTYALENDLKLRTPSHHAVLLPEEVEHLFNNYFEQFCHSHFNQPPVTDQQKKEWLDTFRSNNPVSNRLLAYAYGDGIPPKYHQVSRDFENMASFLRNLRKEFDDLRSARRKETTQIIEGINTKRALALMPFEAMLSHWSQEAVKKRDDDLKKLTPDDTQGRKKVEDEYASSITRYQLYYAAAILPVNTYFDSKVEEAKKNLNDILEKIKQNEAASTAPHFNYAWGLLDYAWKVKNNKPVQPQPIFVPAQIFHIPAPVMPPMVHINFVQQLQQPPQNIPQQQQADYARFVGYQVPAASAPQWWQ